MSHKYHLERVLMKNSTCPNINNANIDVDVRIRDGSTRYFILWSDELRFWRWEHPEIDLYQI